MANKHHLFLITGWALNAAMLISLALTAVLVLAFGVCALAGAGLIHLPIPLEDLKDIKDVPLTLVFLAGAVACASGVFLLALLTLMLLMTGRIVKSADQDPFVEDNARRLMQIGWLLVAMQAVGLGAGMIMALNNPCGFSTRRTSVNDSRILLYSSANWAITRSNVAVSKGSDSMRTIARNSIFFRISACSGT